MKRKQLTKTVTFFFYFHNFFVINFLRNDMQFHQFSYFYHDYIVAAA